MQLPKPTPSYCTHCLIPAALSSSTDNSSLRSLMVLAQVSSSCFWKGPSSRRSSYGETHTLNQLLQDGTW